MSYITIAQKEANLSAGLSAGNDGLFGKIGRGFGSAEANKIYKITSVDEAKYFFGEDSDLTKSCTLHFNQGGSALKCLSSEIDSRGNVTQIADSRLSVSIPSGGKVAGDYKVKLELTAGTLGVDPPPSVRYSIDDGVAWAGEYALSSGEIVIGEAGVLVTVADESVFTDGEAFEFTTTAGAFSVDALKKAIDTFKEDKDIRLLHIANSLTGDKDTIVGVLSYLDSFCTTMALKKQWVRALASVQAFDGTDKNGHIALLNSIGNGFYSNFVTITYKQIFSKALNMAVSESHHLLATLSKAKVHQSPGWTGAFPQKDVLSIGHWDELKNFYSSLSDLGYESMYYEDGEASGVYPFFGIGSFKADSNSDYRKISSGRVMDKACRLIHSAVFPYLRSNQNRAGAIAGSRAGLLGMKSKMEVSLDGMLGRNEIDGYEINIPMLDDPNITVAELAQAILSGKIEGSFKLYPNGHIEELTIDASYALGIEE